jgi:hypothetical protein
MRTRPCRGVAEMRAAADELESRGNGEAGCGLAL